MDATNALIFLSALLVFGSVLASLVSTRLGFPLLLVFLVAGMLAGEDGFGGIQFDDVRTTYLIANLALAVILLDGGLRTNTSSFRVALKPAASLATVGVVLTAGTVALFVAWWMDLDWRYALLLGSIIGSTDAAAVFSSLRHGSVRLNDRVSATLEIESGANDPTAIFLVVAMIGWLEAGAPGTGAFAWSFLAQLGFGALGGIAGGWLLAWLLERVRLVDGLYALLVASGGLVLFAVVNGIGGSGFLAIYLAGLMVANRPTHAAEHVLRVMDGLAWLAQAGMFLLMGLLVTPSRMLEDIGAAIAVAIVLMFVARPFAVWVSLLPFHLPGREIGFISWVGLRGAVPIVLSVFPVMAGVENSALLFNVTFAVVLLSLVVQGTTIPVAARLFRVQVPGIEEPVDLRELDLAPGVSAELAQLRVEPGARCVGHHPVELVRSVFPKDASCIALVRERRIVFPDAQTVFEPLDMALLMLPLGGHPAIAPQFARLPDRGPLSARSFFGEFVLDGSARGSDVVTLYGGEELRADEAELSIAELLRRRLGRPLVVGDRMQLGRVTVTAREIHDDTLTRVGLKLTDEAD